MTELVFLSALKLHTTSNANLMSVTYLEQATMQDHWQVSSLHPNTSQQDANNVYASKSGTTITHIPNRLVCVYCSQ